MCWVLASTLLGYLESHLLAPIPHSQNWAKSFWEQAAACPEPRSALDSTADKKLFEVKRKDQMNALKNLIELNDINQQYKIIDIMLKGLFKVSVGWAQGAVVQGDGFGEHLVMLGRAGRRSRAHRQAGRGREGHSGVPRGLRGQ